MTRGTRTLLAAALAGVLLTSAGCLAAPTAPQPRAEIKQWVEPTATADAPAPVGSTDSTTAPPPSSKLTPAEYRALTSRVRLVGVGIAGEGGYIIARYKAPTKLAALWQPGRLWVVDEATGVKYDDIPIMPLIGALFARPNHEGQVGYVMFVNGAGKVRPGSKVTVVLDAFKAQHVVVR